MCIVKLYLTYQRETKGDYLMANVKLIDKLESFAPDRFFEDDSAYYVSAFIANLYETNAEEPNTDGEDFTSDFHCKRVID